MPAHSTNLNTHQCPYCGASRATPAGVKSHIRQTPQCLAELERRTKPTVAPSTPLVHRSPSPQQADPLGFDDANHSPFFCDPPRTVYHPPPADTAPGTKSSEERQRKRARVEEVEDEEAGGLPRRPFVDYSARNAIRVAGRGQHLFERIHNERKAAGLHPDQNPWAPFDDKAEWELGRWALIHRVGQEAWDDYLKLNVVSRSNLYWGIHYNLSQTDSRKDSTLVPYEPRVSKTSGAASNGSRVEV